MKRGSFISNSVRRESSSETDVAGTISNKYFPLPGSFSRVKHTDKQVMGCMFSTYNIDEIRFLHSKLLGNVLKVQVLEMDWPKHRRLTRLLGNDCDSNVPQDLSSVMNERQIWYVLKQTRDLNGFGPWITEFLDVAEVRLRSSLI